MKLLMIIIDEARIEELEARERLKVVAWGVEEVLG